MVAIDGACGGDGPAVSLNFRPSSQIAPNKCKHNGLDLLGFIRQNSDFLLCEASFDITLQIHVTVLLALGVGNGRTISLREGGASFVILPAILKICLDKRSLGRG
jgi:hypothetical protein